MVLLRSSVFVLATLSLCVLSCGCHVYRDAPQPMSPPTAPEWNLVWADEFNGPDGSAPDPKKWRYDMGGKGWGNSELECYTDLAQNAQVKDGTLVITALLQPGYACSDGTVRDYTSARLKTQGLFSQAYGR